MKTLSTTELKKVNGGLILVSDDRYWAISDDGEEYFDVWPTLDQAAQHCKREGQNVEIITAKEYEKRFDARFPG